MKERELLIRSVVNLILAVAWDVKLMDVRECLYVCSERKSRMCLALSCVMF